MAFTGTGRLEGALTQLAQAADLVACGADLREALQSIAEAAALATGAELAVVRLLDPVDGQFAAVAVAASSRARAAEVEGTRFPAGELGAEEVADLEQLPATIRRIAGRYRSDGVLQLPISAGNGPVASLELLRVGGRFDDRNAVLARLAASHVALCLRAARNGTAERGAADSGLLALAGEALAVGSPDDTDPQRVARLAVTSWGADRGLIWRVEDGAPTALLASVGAKGGEDEARALVEAALTAADVPALEREDGRLPPGYALSAVVPLGRPAAAALQLLFARSNVPPEDQLGHLAAFGARAAGALRAAERARALSIELDRSRALLAVLRQATAELSLAHTLETALEGIGSLLSVTRLAVYLREGEGLVTARSRGPAGPHVAVADRLLELALGPTRGSGALVVDHTRGDDRLAQVRQELEETGVEAAVAVPLVANEEVIGLLALYPNAGRTPEEHELDLLSALAVHLAVAVQNARLHEQAKDLGRRLERSLAAESAERRRLDGLYEVSRSFAQSLSLDATLEAVTRAAVESLGVGAAVLRVPDARGEALVAQAVHVADPRLEQALRSILSRTQVISRPALQKFFRGRQPLHLDRARARALGGSFELLVPFLEKGSTAVVIPLATPEEVLATLSLISLDPARPITDETAEAALSLGGQAALAIENARLYQQQKDFADSMQRALLPADHPDVPGLDFGVVYESSARMDVGGDLYDFLALDGGRLALVLGDVTGHGVLAAADMAMAKFVFRSLAREHPEPADFLTHANDVVAEEITLGKFITLLYIVFDPVRGEVAGAAAGHPPPRIVDPGGTVTELPLRGLALGVESGQPYDEVRRPLPPGTAVVLYTDGLIEARRGRDFYGIERVDAFLAGNPGLEPQALAEALVEDCRRFGGGELADDCAVVVIRRRT